MTLKEARNIILKRYLDAYRDSMKVATTNKFFEPPVEKWARIIVLPNGGGQESLGKAGNRKFKYIGLITIQIFTLNGKGTNGNDILAQDSLELMDSFSSGTLNTHSGGIFPVGTDGEYYQQNVVIEYNFENIR